jgi:hypothetical protein
MLGDFFDKVDHGFDFFDKNLPSGDDLAYTWQEDVAPTFYGTSTSPPQQQQQQVSLSGIQGIDYNVTNGHLGLMPGEMPSAASEDVLAAASLLHNGHGNGHGNGQGHGHGHSHGHGHGHGHGHVHPNHIENPLFSAQDMSHQLMGPPSGTRRSENLQAQQFGTLHTNIRRTSASATIPPASHTDSNLQDTLYPDMIFGGPFNQASEQHSHQSQVLRPTKRIDIRWGSDQGFGRKNFTPSAELDTVDAVEAGLMHHLECFQHESASNTRPSSPRPAETQNPPDRLTKAGDAADGQEDISDEEDEEKRPRKRRKSRLKVEDEDDDEDGSGGTKPRRPKHSTKSSRGHRSSFTESPSKARKSEPGGPKAARENLTEEQKRENHIRSEQKRRTLIKEGFEDLCKLVPELHGGGYSKSAVLMQAADWLQDLLSGNERLKQQLRELDETEGRINGPGTNWATVE